MIRRHRDQVFGSALVFPGGTVDESDHSPQWSGLIDAGSDDPRFRALKIAGFREMFEETGILLARNADGEHVAAQGTRTDPFIEVVRASSGRLILDDLVHFGHWITPERLPKRFDTHFFVARAGPHHEGTCDHQESVALEWATPSGILDRAAAGADSIMFPTRMNISRLAGSQSADSALQRARRTPVVTVLPRVEKRPDGTAVLIPEEAGYGVSENFIPNDPGKPGSNRA